MGSFPKHPAACGGLVQEITNECLLLAVGWLLAQTSQQRASKRSILVVTRQSCVSLPRTGPERGRLGTSEGKQAHNIGQFYT